jgi:hypothetical protein
MDLGALDWRLSFEPKQRVMRGLVVLRRFVQHPIMPLVGALIGAGTAKTGHGAWAASMMLTSLPIYFGLVVTTMLTRNLGSWIARMQRYEGDESARRPFMNPSHSDMRILPANRMPSRALDSRRR